MFFFAIKIFKKSFCVVIDELKFSEKWLSCEIAFDHCANNIDVLYEQPQRNKPKCYHEFS